MHPDHIHRRWRLWALAGLLLAAGCSQKPNPARQVENGVAFAKAQFEKINTDPAAALAFGSQAEMGGSPLSYLAACIGDPAGLPSFAEGKPAAPYTVVISFDSQQGCFVIEGYTQDLAKPAMVEKVAYRPPTGRAQSQPPPGNAPAPAGAQNTTDKAELSGALLQASESGAAETVTTLIAQGADVNARSNEGGTPLMYACAKGHAAIVQTLLAAGADPKAIAHEQNRWPVIMYAAYCGSPEIMTLLLEKGADPNSCDQFKNTPLMLAAMHGHDQAVELLIRAGANLNAQETKQHNFPLLLAVSRGNAGVAARLIAAGADVNLSDKSGLTALMSCAEKGQAGIAADLIKAGANLEATLTGEIGRGATPLMLAAAKGQEEMVRLLLTSGANVKATDKNGSPAYRYATHNGHAAIAELLQAAEQGSVPKAAPTAAAQVVRAATKPAASAAPRPGAGADLQPGAGDPQALIGKDQKAADDMFGKPVGTIKQGNTTIVMYRNAEVVIKQNVITKVKASR